MALGHHIDCLEERETGRAYLTAIRTIGSICNQIDTEFAFGTLHNRVGSTGRHMIAFSEELEVMDQRFHRPLHLRSMWRAELAILHLYRTRPHLVQALADNLHTLTHFGEPHEIAVVAITIPPDRHLEPDLGIFVVGLRASQIPRHTARAQTRSGEA